MPRVLVFSATAGYRHDSIPAGAAALAEIAAPHGLDVVHTEDSAELGAALLTGCAAVVFLSPTGDVLDDPTRRRLRAYVTGGGGFLGVHAAACAEEGWPYYERLVGARFDGHPEIQPAEVTVEDRTHPATAHLPERWAWTDEWYNFRADPRDNDGADDTEDGTDDSTDDSTDGGSDGGTGNGVRVLASVDERGYTGGTMGAGHPLVWCRRLGAGRSFYTALGHREAAYADPDFRAHLRGALLWCAGAAGD